MEILEDKTCPKCGDPDGLFVCELVGAVNCQNCHEYIRPLTKEEAERVVRKIPELLRKKGAKK